MRSKAVTLCSFLKNAGGEKIVVELKDESAVEGVLVGADDSMNLELENATLYRRRLQGVKPVKTSYIYLSATFVRFVHFENYLNVLKVLSRTYRPKKLES